MILLNAHGVACALPWVDWGFSVVSQGNACLSATSSLGVRDGSASVFPQRASSLQRGGKHRRDWGLFFFSFWCNTEMGTKCKHAKTPILPPPPPGNQALWRRGVRTHSNMAYCFASVVPALRQKNITTRRPKKKEKAKGNKSGGVVGKERREKKLKAPCSRTSRAAGEPNERRKLHQSFKVIVGGKEPAFSACDSTFPY